MTTGVPIIAFINQLRYSLTSPPTPLLIKATVYTQVGVKYEGEGKAGINEMENPIEIHASRFEGKAFGDPRLIKRGRNYTMQWESTIV